MEELIEKNFRIGFNHGYWLARAGGNELSHLLETQNNKTSYYKGFTSGKREWEKEVQLQKIREKSSRSKGKDFDIER